MVLRELVTWAKDLPAVPNYIQWVVVVAAGLVILLFLIAVLRMFLLLTYHAFSLFLELFRKPKWKKETISSLPKLPKL